MISSFIAQNSVISDDYIGCEMNQILLRTLKNHLKRYILGEKMYYHHSNHRSNHDGYYNGYQDRYYDGYHDQPWLPS